MLDDITIATFADRIGESFPIRIDAETTYDTVLGGVIDFSDKEHPRPDGMREPFAVLFRGPSMTYLPQGSYLLEHAELGPLELFLVPIQPDAEGSLYQAVFG